MIVSFASRKAERLWQRRPDHGLPPQIERVALRKLTQLDRSQELRDLQLPPGNRLEPLRGDRAGQHSVRINDQYRLCFRWQGEDAYDVEIVDYH
ncbi:MAG: type II toxin-antitoxin system RelE/ParE family toxin [Verrucomicrobia bacterium]|nr:type II toxin-antitoxin system RelE/ParE family toxin [Verrucomicrobiota bacterium]